ncbi:uncharacterized protein [Epargyreus clarus]|uniref:uncharacterized protein isoform X2 n=1 Tax=Epargyreus clarus TaxID=520877 RepID=UPI003C2C39CE
MPTGQAARATRILLLIGMLDSLCGFKFIPRSTDDSCIIEKDGLITRTFAEDTSYVFVKVEGDGLDGNAARKARLDGIARKAQVRPQKPPVDLRGPFTCTLPSTLRPDVQCRQIFFNCCEYSMHYREEHTKRRKAALRCQVCEKRLDRDMYPAPTMASQFNVPHRLTFSCQTCGHTFLSSAEFDEHNRIVHAKMKPHQCSLCNKRFTQQGGLQQHMRMHTGIRPFACTYCPKAFTQKAGLDQHLRTHTKVKPFKCVICSKCFSQSVHLRQHMRTHTNIQPFQCPVCGRRFKQSSHLNFHMRSHMGEMGSLMPEQYPQSTDHQNQLDFFNLANVQPVQDGETLYYAAELVTGSSQNTYISYSPKVINENILSL